MPYQILDHTADTGLRITGENLKEIFLSAALGLFFLITGQETIETRDSENVDQAMELLADDEGELLLKWLRELLYLFSARRIMPVFFDFKELTKKKLKAGIVFVKYDPERHGQNEEVKAITYHGFKFEKTPGGWIAEVIVDV